MLFSTPGVHDCRRIGPCLRQSVRENPSAQHCLLISGRILGTEGSSHLLTWASLLHSLRALCLLPSLKNQSMFPGTMMLWCWWSTLSHFPLCRRMVVYLSFQSPDPCTVLFSPFACSFQVALLRIDIKCVLGGGNSWGHVLISGCKSHVP